MNRAIRLLPLVVFACLAASCAGPAPRRVDAPASLASSVPGPGSTVAATLRVVIPTAATNTSANARRPRYVSPATQSMGISFVPAGGGATIAANQNLTAPTNPNCTASLLTALTCTLTFALTPGAYTATFTTYDGPLDGNGMPTGSVLSANQAVPVAIVAGQANAINVSLQGVPASLAILAAPTAGTTVGGSSGMTWNRCFTSETVSVVALDADQNIIVGPGAPVPNLTTNSTLISIAQPSVARPNAFLVLPTGTPPVGSTATLSASVVPLAGSGAQPLSAAMPVSFTVDYCGAGLWVAAWALPGSHGSSFPGTPSSEQTFRYTVKPSVGSRGTIRLHLTNSVGLQPVTIGALHVGIKGVGAAVVPGTDQVVTFGGSGSVTIPAGGTAVSDSLGMAFPYGTLLAVTQYVAGSWPWLSSHAPGVTLVTSYQTPQNAGNAVLDTQGASFTQTTTTVSMLDRIDVLGNYKETVAFIGSSTTDGFGADPDQFDSLSDDLATRLHAAGRDDTAVVNMAITPNALTPADELPIGELSIIDRFPRDIAALPGIGVVIQNGGDVDLKGGTCRTAAAIIPFEQQFIGLAHAAGIRVLLPTVAPATWCGAKNTGPQFPANTGSDAERNLLNSWITSTGPMTIEGAFFAPPSADLFADFSGAVIDPNNQGYMLPALTYDYSHPNAAGQALQAATIPLSSL